MVFTRRDFPCNITTQFAFKRATTRQQRIIRLKHHTPKTSRTTRKHRNRAVFTSSIYFVASKFFGRPLWLH